MTIAGRNVCIVTRVRRAPGGDGPTATFCATRAGMLVLRHVLRVHGASAKGARCHCCRLFERQNHHPRPIELIQRKPRTRPKKAAPVAVVQYIQPKPPTCAAAPLPPITHMSAITDLAPRVSAISARYQTAAPSDSFGSPASQLVSSPASDAAIPYDVDLGPIAFLDLDLLGFSQRDLAPAPAPARSETPQSLASIKLELLEPVAPPLPGTDTVISPLPPIARQPKKCVSAVDLGTLLTPRPGIHRSPSAVDLLLTNQLMANMLPPLSTSPAAVVSFAEPPRTVSPRMYASEPTLDACQELLHMHQLMQFEAQLRRGAFPR